MNSQLGVVSFNTKKFYLEIYVRESLCDFSFTGFFLYAIFCKDITIMYTANSWIKSPSLKLITEVEIIYASQKNISFPAKFQLVYLSARIIIIYVWYYDFNNEMYCFSNVSPDVFTDVYELSDVQIV